jgi:hypothetical protein
VPCGVPFPVILPPKGAMVRTGAAWGGVPVADCDVVSSVPKLGGAERGVGAPVRLPSPPRGMWPRRRITPCVEPGRVDCERGGRRRY